VNRRPRFGWLLAGLTLVCFVHDARALDPDSGMADYTRDRWGAEQGFPGANVYAVTQTADGYLWLGTERGLVRYDGVSFHLYGQADSPLFPTGPVQELMTDADGNLWIRPQSRSLLRYRDGALQDVTPELDAGHSGITAMCRGAKGGALFAVRSDGVFTYTDGRFEKLLSTAEQPNWLVIAMAATGDGRIWMGTRDAGILVMSAGKVSAVQGLPDRKVNSLLAAADGGVWVGTDGGLARLNGDGPQPVGAPAPLDQVQSLALLTDHESNTWVGTDRGLFRLNSGGVFALEEGARGAAAVNTIFEDREGSLWVGSTGGVERLRDSAFMTYAPPDGLSPEGGAVYVDVEGRAWLAPLGGGLYWRKGARVARVKEAGLDSDVVYSVAGRPGELWLGRRDGGLTRLRYDGGALSSETYTRADGLAQNSVYAVALSRDGAVWAGTLSGGVTRLKDGAFTTYTAASGLASDSVLAVLESSDGTMWFATASGLSSLSKGSWRTYGSVDGLPPGGVNCLAEDSTGALWVGTDNGIAVVSAGLVKVPREVPESLREPVLGIAEDGYGWLWVSTTKHVLRVRRDKLEGGAPEASDVREFGPADGLRGVEGVRRHMSAVADAAGRIWLSTSHGLSVVNPSRVANNSVPAIVHVKAITADGNEVDMRGAVRVPGDTRRITFSFVGLSLNVPERVRYRYRLDGFDGDWSEPAAAREAVYTNLGPGSYRFRVMASNSEGLWNGQESVVWFEIEPTVWQTWWFRLACVLGVGLAIFAFYRARVRRLTRLINVRSEERLAERTRIAQDLHDTLLQGVLSASMQLHVAADQLPDASPAKPLVGRVLEVMAQVVEEGRAAVRGLRAPAADSGDIAEALSAIRHEFTSQEEAKYRITVKGQPRPLHPLIRDGAYRIGREALLNAFRHARARNVEVEIEYGARSLRLTVRDDGTGIDPQVLSSGRSGHWGLSGMRERARDFGAQFEVRSRAGEGTEVRLSIPGDVAFESNVVNDREGRRGRFLPRRWRRSRRRETDK
jgi:signal transduction histidine kinase/ligand-binding sensor domain-containing protein